MAPQNVGRSPKGYKIPRRVPILDFPVSKGDLKSIDQISVHSGTNAWGYELGQ